MVLNTWVLQKTNLSSSSYNWGNIDNGQYYWKVRAKNVVGDWGDWSETWTFISNHHRITSISPDQGSQNQSLSVTITGQNTHFGSGSPFWFTRSKP